MWWPLDHVAPAASRAPREATREEQGTGTTPHVVDEAWARVKDAGNPPPNTRARRGRSWRPPTATLGGEGRAQNVLSVTLARRAGLRTFQVPPAPAKVALRTFQASPLPGKVGVGGFQARPGASNGVFLNKNVSPASADLGGDERQRPTARFDCHGTPHARATVLRAYSCEERVCSFCGQEG